MEKGRRGKKGDLLSKRNKTLIQSLDNFETIRNKIQTDY